MGQQAHRRAPVADAGEPGLELEIELDKLVRAADPAVRLHASHGFAVAALREFLDEHHVRHDLKYCGSLEAVAALASGGCDIAGFHVPVGEFEAPVLARFRARLRADTLPGAPGRAQGLFVEAGNPRRIVGLEDPCRPGVRFVNRQEGSGTRLLLDLLLQARGIAPARIDGYRNGEFTHAAVAAYIGSGMADVGFGVETAARRFGLGFVPVLKERYFFAIEQRCCRRRPGARRLGAAQRQLPRTRGRPARLRRDADRHGADAGAGIRGI